MSISVGTWSAITVLVSFGFGLGLFREQVVSLEVTIGGVGIMLIGFAGISVFEYDLLSTFPLPTNNHHNHHHKMMMVKTVMMI